MRFVRLVPLVLCFAACKGKTVYKDSQQTIDTLGACKQQRDQLSKDNRTLADQLAGLERDQVPIVVAFEGDVLTVRPHHGGGGHGPPIDDATVAKQSQAFLDMVERSRGAIQKCYEQALKKDTGLQVRTVSLKLSARFTSTGAFNGSSFDPSLGDAFDACMHTVAGRWKMPAAPRAMTFQAHVSLSPT
jgi:hypothetical protein